MPCPPGWLAQWHTPLSWQHTRELEPGNVHLLLAEVEHRAWLKDLKAHLGGKQDSPPALGHGECRFGLWLNKASTRRRFGQMEEFERLQTLHREVHDLGTTLARFVHPPRIADADMPGHTEPTSASPSVEIKAIWKACQHKSKALLNALRNMRHTMPTPASGLMP